MRLLLTIISICLWNGLFAQTVSAQPDTSRIPVPIADITKAYEAPADVLNSTLQKVDELKSNDTSADNVQITAANREEPTEFINPFIPQIPKPDVPEIVETIVPGQPVPVPPTAPIPQFTVSGLVWNTKKPAAILNGKIVGIGDKMNNWDVTEITKDGVRVAFEEQHLWVKPIVDPNATRQPNQRNF